MWFGWLHAFGPHAGPILPAAAINVIDQKQKKGEYLQQRQRQITMDMSL